MATDVVLETQAEDLTDAQNFSQEIEIGKYNVLTKTYDPYTVDEINQKVKKFETDMEGWKNNQWQGLLTNDTFKKKSKKKKKPKNDNILEQGKCMLDMSY